MPNKSRKWIVKRMKLAELKPAAYNPRKMSVEALQGLEASISKFGMLVPIVWNKRTGNVVGGHQRLKILMEKGEKETDVIVVDLTDHDEVALNIALNSKTIRGDFTSDIIPILERVEVQLGSAFNQLNLNDLFKDMSQRFAKEMKQNAAPPEPRPSSKPLSPSGDVPPQDVKEPDAIITCPGCRSRFKMKNNEVVFNSRLQETV